MWTKEDTARYDTVVWLEFVTNGVCGLCGNNGKIARHTVVSPVNRVVHVGEHYCICPNGRCLKHSDAIGYDNWEHRND